MCLIDCWIAVGMTVQILCLIISILNSLQVGGLYGKLGIIFSSTNIIEWILVNELYVSSRSNRWRWNTWITTNGRLVANENDVLIFADVAIRAVDGKASFGLIVNLKTNINSTCKSYSKARSSSLPKRLKQGQSSLLWWRQKNRSFIGRAVCRMPRSWCKLLMESIIVL